MPFAEAVALLRRRFAWNPWFIDSYWPENAPRIERMARLAAAHAAPGRALEVGCANGYVAFLFSCLGHIVTAVDAYDDPKRTELFAERGIAYRSVNLNDPEPLHELAPASFDLVLMGEVFEHILNHPRGLLDAARRVLAPGGLLILTTPNPNTLANAARVLTGRGMLWGTKEFVNDVKFDGRTVLDRGDIHYREYPMWYACDLLREAGFRITAASHVRTGTSRGQSAFKRVLKHALRLTGLAGTRLFAPGYIIAAVPA